MNKSKKDILVVDDSESIRKFVRMLLEESNYNVFEACNGEEGIQVYEKTGNIDLIITDIYMPKKTGLDLIMELNKRHKGIKIIVFSDGGKYNFSNQLGECEGIGATCFIKKASIKDELVNMVNNMFLE
ncbi:response regulator [Clostridium sp. MB40-C1]|uniref:response regulator n=1 Tax=Clostridium sp. MB40-C1 TaxID=3070996 RepID=UPI0027E14074|nr:response regulator [Clostridium sp. MB40-C1]WMJ79064.1 response regulator [Clostridium sp. MB40-C1]